MTDYNTGGIDHRDLKIGDTYECILAHGEVEYLEWSNPDPENTETLGWKWPSCYTTGAWAEKRPNVVESRANY